MGGWQVNARKPIPPDIGDHLSYDPDTGHLTWVREQASGNHPRAGCVAGYLHVTGCILVSFRRKMYGAHRIAWFLKTGCQPPDIIDHADLNPANNRWTNLRAATASQNTINRRQLGPLKKGVKRSRKSPGFEARIRCDGKEHYLGFFRTEDEAHAAYIEAAIRLHGEFARFE